jgi:hypothetical protein
MSPQLEIHGLPPRTTAGLRADPRLAGALAALGRRAARARVAFTDENGPKGGPAIRCAVTVNVPPRGYVHVEAQAMSARLALGGALTKLERGLARATAIERAARRRPKKYYAARALTG